MACLSAGWRSVTVTSNFRFKLKLGVPTADASQRGCVKFDSQCGNSCQLKVSSLKAQDTKTAYVKIWWKIRYRSVFRLNIVSGHWFRCHFSKLIHPPFKKVQQVR